MKAAEDAGRLVKEMPRLWREANTEDRRKPLLSILDMVYVEANELKQVEAIQSKAAFRPIFQVATTK